MNNFCRHPIDIWKANNFRKCWTAGVSYNKIPCRYCMYHHLSCKPQQHYSFDIVYFPPSVLLSLSHSQCLFSLTPPSPYLRPPRSALSSCCVFQTIKWFRHKSNRLPPSVAPSSHRHNHHVSGLSLLDFVRLAHKGSMQLRCLSLIMWRRPGRLSGHRWQRVSGDRTANTPSAGWHWTEPSHCVSSTRGC